MKERKPGYPQNTWFEWFEWQEHLNEKIAEQEPPNEKPPEDGRLIEKEQEPLDDQPL